MNSAGGSRKKLRRGSSRFLSLQHTSQEIEKPRDTIRSEARGFSRRTEIFYSVNYRNLLIVLALLSATTVSFFWGGYQTLMPFMFVTGLVLISVISLWSSLYMETRSLVTLSFVTMAISAVDEYAHTSSGAFSYFDGMTPSPLTVFGWSILVLGIVTIAQCMYQRIPLVSLDGRVQRSLLVVAPVSLLIASAWAQGYLRFFDSSLVFVYLFLSMASLYYSSSHRFGWSLWVVTSSLVFSTLMEYLGGIEGLWVYQFNEPMALFIVFTWTLRVLTILAVSSLLGVEIPE
jgi:hypothetical protein